MLSNPIHATTCPPLSSLASWLTLHVRPMFPAAVVQALSKVSKPNTKAAIHKTRDVLHSLGVYTVKPTVALKVGTAHDMIKALTVGTSLISLSGLGNTQESRTNLYKSDSAAVQAKFVTSNQDAVKRKFVIVELNRFDPNHHLVREAPKAVQELGYFALVIYPHDEVTALGFEAYQTVHLLDGDGGTYLQAEVLDSTNLVLPEARVTQVAQPAPPKPAPEPEHVLLEVYGQFSTRVHEALETFLYEAHSYKKKNPNANLDVIDLCTSANILLSHLNELRNSIVKKS